MVKESYPDNNFLVFFIYDSFETAVLYEIILSMIVNSEAVTQRCSVKKRVLRKFAKSRGKHLCQSLFFNKFASLRPKACNFIKKETLAQVFSCEFYEISKNTFFYRTPLVAASAVKLLFEVCNQAQFYLCRRYTVFKSLKFRSETVISYF